MKPERAGLFRHSTLLLLWLIAGGTQSVWPQSDNAAKPEIQQLQGKLELMQTQMQQLKDEIMALQHASKNHLQQKSRCRRLIKSKNHLQQKSRCRLLRPEHQ